MRTGGQSALTVRGTCLAAGLAFCLGFAYAGDQPQIDFGEKTVSIRADDASIRTVLEELSRQSGLAIESQENLTERVTIDIKAPSLSEAIRQLLRQKSFLLHQMKSNDDSTVRVPRSRLWIFSEDSSDAFWSTQPRSELIEYQVLALSEKSGDRQDAMYGFGENGSDTAIVYLQQGLVDPDERVRRAAIESLAEIGGTDSALALGLVLSGPDVSLRIDAVDALGQIGGPDAIQFLQKAMADQNHTVREAAAEWLTELAWRSD